MKRKISLLLVLFSFLTVNTIFVSASNLDDLERPIEALLGVYDNRFFPIRLSSESYQKPVAVSSTLNSADVAALIDSNKDSAWIKGSGDAWPQSVFMDMGSLMYISGADIVWHCNGKAAADLSRDARASYEYKILLSSDNDTWYVGYEQKTADENRFATADKEWLSDRFKPFEARYIKIVVTGCGGTLAPKENEQGIKEIKIVKRDDASDLTNLSLKKPVTTSHLDSTFIPEKANDGVVRYDPSSEVKLSQGEWGNAWYPRGQNKPSWWQCDLGKNYDLKAISIYWANEDQYNYNIQGSENGVDFINIYENELKPNDQRVTVDGKQQRALKRLVEFKELSGNYRYIRVQINSVNADISGSSFGIIECIVYGSSNDIFPEAPLEPVDAFPKSVKSGEVLKTLYNQAVTLTSSKSGAEIYYTIDGTDPKVSDTKIKYDESKPIFVDKPTVVKCYSVFNGITQSAVSEYKYTTVGGYHTDTVFGDEFSETTDVWNVISGDFNIAQGRSFLSSDESGKAEISSSIIDFESGANYILTLWGKVYQGKGNLDIKILQGSTVLTEISIQKSSLEQKKLAFFVPEDSSNIKINIKASGNNFTAVMDSIAIEKRTNSAVVTAQLDPEPTNNNIMPGTNVLLKSSIDSQKLYYTLDGTSPAISLSALEYNAPIVLLESQSIKACSVDSDGIPSEVFSRDYIMSTKTMGVESNYASGEYLEAFTVELSCKTPGAKIYYTLNGSDPKTSSDSILYKNPFLISETTTLNAFASVDGKLPCENKELVFLFSDNQYKNGGFENGLMGWQDWSGFMKIDTVNPHTGKKCMLVAKNSAVSQTDYYGKGAGGAASVKLKANTTYAFYAYAMHTSAVGNRTTTNLWISYDVLGDNPNTSLAENGYTQRYELAFKAEGEDQVPLEEHEYRKKVIMFTTPDASLIVGTAQIGIWKLHGYSNFYIDDISLVEVDSLPPIKASVNSNYVTKGQKVEFKTQVPNTKIYLTSSNINLKETIDDINRRIQEDASIPADQKDIKKAEAKASYLYTQPIEINKDTQLQIYGENPQYCSEVQQFHYSVRGYEVKNPILVFDNGNEIDGSYYPEIPSNLACFKGEIINKSDKEIKATLIVSAYNKTTRKTEKIISKSITAQPMLSEVPVVANASINFGDFGIQKDNNHIFSIYILDNENSLKALGESFNYDY